MKKIMTRLLISFIFLALGATAALVLSITGDIIHDILKNDKIESKEEY